MDSGEDLVKLKADNTRLLKTLREFTIEKNLMEAKLYRAFHRLLQTKKRKITELRRQIKRLKGDEDADSSSSDEPGSGYHCRTCSCHSRTKAQNLRTAADADSNNKSNGAIAASVVDDDSDTAFENSTDLDDEPASKTSSKATSPVKPRPNVLQSDSCDSCEEDNDKVALPSASGAVCKSKGAKEAAGTEIIYFAQI